MDVAIDEAGEKVCAGGIDHRIPNAHAGRRHHIRDPLMLDAHIERAELPTLRLVERSPGDPDHRALRQVRVRISSS